MSSPDRPQLVRAAKRLAKSFQQAAQEHPRDEAGFLAKAEDALDETVQFLGSPPLDKRSELTLVTGRADAVFNRLIVEWEPPTGMSGTPRHAGNRHAVGQLRRYVDGLAEKERRKLDRLAGVACDGHFMIFARYRGGQWTVDEPIPVDERSAEQLLTSILAAQSGRALTAENLLKDFSSNLLSRQLAAALLAQLNEELEREPQGQTARLFAQWERLFAVATGVTGEAASLKADARKALAGALGVKPAEVDASRSLFALQTYFALITKLIATLALSLFVERAEWDLADLASGGDEDLLEDLVRLHQGDPFRNIGLGNVVEPDVFGWFLGSWTQAVRDHVRLVANRLKEYDPATLQVSPEDARDLLKDLYQGLLPRPLRHALGQYFTPDWLAERTLNLLDYRGDPGQRLLDPSSGTGTFLVLAIARLKKSLRDQGASDSAALKAILSHVVGFDIDPLAVVAARANYVLALGSLVGSVKDDVDIPVYLADSVLSPTLEELHMGNRLSLETAAGRFDLPACIETDTELRQVCDLVSEALDEDWPAADFVKRASAACGADAAAEKILEDFLLACREEHAIGVAGIWPRVIRNAFMPAFQAPFDVIAGNPPWVNWESLPAAYRERTKPIWERAGLFVHRGMEVMLGAGKKDMAMLMSYTVTERLLRDGGRLGFVVTQTVFKTAGAGQGFRRFRYGDVGPDVKVEHVDDMVDLNPFRGASNRTALMVWARGERTRYPVSYTLWQRLAAEGLRRHATIEEVERLARPLPLVASPVSLADPTSPWLTAPRDLVPALRKLAAPEGEAPYVAHAGVYSGGTNGVYWLSVDGEEDGDGRLPVTNLHDVGDTKLPKVYGRIEKELIHPLVRGADVQRWEARTWNHILFVQDPESRQGIATGTMKERYPGALEFLGQFEKSLRKRAAFKRYHSKKPRRGGEPSPFWSMFDVGQYTMARHKVVWKDQARDFAAAVIGSDEPMPLPNHKVMLVACQSDEEAHYLCGALNSVPVRSFVAAYAIETQISTHTVKYIGIPRFDPDLAEHRDLVAASRQAHEAVRGGEEPDQEAVDRAAGILWDLDADEIAGMSRFLAEVTKRDLVTE